MRSTKLLIAMAAVFALVACNSGQPRLYKIAVDTSQLGNLPATCYLDNAQPTVRETASNLMREMEWALWDGVDGIRFLDLGSADWQLGHAETIGNVGELIQSNADDNKLFTGTYSRTQLPTQANPSYTNTQTQSVTVRFEELGATASGTIRLRSQYTCSNCQNNDFKVADCAAELKFTGRRIDADSQSFYMSKPHN
jgi:hypothetical protein